MWLKLNHSTLDKPFQSNVCQGGPKTFVHSLMCCSPMKWTYLGKFWISEFIFHDNFNALCPLISFLDLDFTKVTDWWARRIWKNIVRLNILVQYNKKPNFKSRIFSLRCEWGWPTRLNWKFHFCRFHWFIKNVCYKRMLHSECNMVKVDKPVVVVVAADWGPFDHALKKVMRTRW